MVIKKKRKWTVFFLVKSVDDSTDELISMMDEIRSLHFSSEIAVVFCVNIAEQNVRALLLGDVALLSKPDVKKTFTTVFLHLEPDPDNPDVPNKLAPIDEEVQFDLTLAEHLALFFKSRKQERFRAKRYMLFTWDHGNAFGIFGRHPDTKELLWQAENITALDEPEIIERVNRLFVIPETDDLLTMDELAASLEAGFGDSRIDIIAMDSRYRLCFAGCCKISRSVGACNGF
jgi:hypothetical protein